jgi:hypothetical protein
MLLENIRNLIDRRSDMSTAIRKMFLVGVLALACLTFSFGSAHAALYTVNSVTDAAKDPYQIPFTTLYDTTSGLSYSTGPITTLAQAQAAVSANIPSGDSWVFRSAGNGGTSAIPIAVGLYSLAAGTYHIRAVSGGYTYDNWGWSTDADQRYRWLLQIMTSVNGTYTNYTLGNGQTTTYATAAEAEAANAGSTIDITLASGGDLTFWIWDVNTMDNYGSLVFDVTSAPLPPSLLLMLGGLAFVLVPRLRSRIKD